MSYNVVEDRREWARVKAGLMPPEDRRFLMEELMRRDQKQAAEIIGELVSSEHAARARARRPAYP